MKFIKTEIEGLILMEPDVFRDARGCFFESYNERALAAYGIHTRFVQDNQSVSCYGVIRGLHCQLGEHAQAKLVRVLTGRVLDVAVDIRSGSPTFGKHLATELSAENRLQLYIPRGFLHGFAVLSERAVFSYKVDNFYCKEAEFGIRYDDPEIGIDWQLPAEAILTSDKDRLANSLQDVPDYW